MLAYEYQKTNKEESLKLDFYISDIPLENTCSIFSFNKLLDDYVLRRRQ